MHEVWQIVTVGGIAAVLLLSAIFYEQLLFLDKSLQAIPEGDEDDTSSQATCLRLPFATSEF